ncbi:MAG TPA: peptidylprolyl isomerase [Casimicrobiaceae bacterium]|mgnify:CR=1 FL=1|nr:peptidylprolyl isomerase [Casimicrobiaceae bacterium]
MSRSILALAFAAALASAPALAQKVELDTTAGKIVLELDAKAAPKTVENFVAYVKAGHYNGTQFHRVIDGFMIQGGGYTTDFSEKPTRPGIRNEADVSSKAGLVNTPGTIAMARTRDPHSASAQFFINVADNKFLNYRESTVEGYGYTVFGKVVSGMDVVNRIAKTPTGKGGPFPKDVPATPVVITSARVL